jgi:hypothetical protein
MPKAARITIDWPPGTFHARPRRGERRRLFGFRRLLFQQTLEADTTGMGLNETSAAAVEGRLTGSPETTNAGPPGADRSMSEVWFDCAIRF